MKAIKTSEKSDRLEDELIFGKNRPEKPPFFNRLVFFLLCLLPIVSTILFGAVDYWVLALNSVIIGLIAIAWLADSFFSKSFRYSSSVLQIPVAGLILIGMIQLLPIANAGATMQNFVSNTTLTMDATATQLAVIQLIQFLVFFAAALVFIDSEKRIRKIVFLFIGFASLMGFFAIIQSLSGETSIYGIRPAPHANPFGSFVNRHHFASFMLMLIGLTLGLLYGGGTEKDKRLLLVISIIVMGLAVILTGSRGGIISLFGVIGFVTLLNFSSKNYKADDFETEAKGSGLRGKLILLFGSLGLVILLIGSVLFVGGDGALMRGVGMNEMTDVSTGRLDFWKTALQIIAAYPILGVGLNAFGVAYTQFDKQNGAMWVDYAHNEYLHIFADAGIFGLACVLIFIFFLFKKSLNLYQQTTSDFGRSLIAGSLAGCFGILIHSFVDFPLRTNSNGFFFLLLVVLATTKFAYAKHQHHRHRRRRRV